MKVRMTPVYAPPNFIGGVFLGPIGWEAEFELPEPTAPKALLSVAQIAKIIGVSRTTANEMVRDGTIPSKPIRGRKKIRRDDLEAFLKRGAAARPRRRAS